MAGTLICLNQMRTRPSNQVNSIDSKPCVVVFLGDGGMGEIYVDEDECGGDWRKRRGRT